MKPSLREVGDPGKHVGKPGLWVDVVELSRHDQGRHGGSTLGTTIGAGEQPGFAGRMDRSTVLLSSSMRPSSMKRVRPSQRDKA